MPEPAQKPTVTGVAGENRKKSLLFAYFLWLVLGTLGAHRIYVGKTGTGLAILGLFTLSAITISLGISIGVFLFVIVGLWLLWDFLLLPGLVKEHANRMRANSQELPAKDHDTPQV